jgi:dipeptidyl aminopeptidase/acylaminoacyl peptidase
VVHWDGTQIDDWSFTPPQFLDRPVLSGDGRALVGSVRGVTTMYDATGTVFTPPRANAVAWAPDRQSLIATTSQGLVRWKLGAAATDVTVIDAKVRGFQMTSAGNRFVIAGMGSAQVVEIDAQGAQVGVTTQSTRWPSAFANVAAGKADFAIVAADRAAHVLDLTKGGALIDNQHATAIIRTLAFSPDGTKLVFSGTPQELVVADARSGAISERLPVKAMSIDQLRWTREAIIASGFRTLIRWNRDRVTEGTKAVTESIDDAGAPVDGMAACAKLPPPQDAGTEFRSPPAPVRVDAAGDLIAASCRQGLAVFRRKDLSPLVSTTERPYAFSLAGPQARVVYGKGRDLHVVDAKGDRVAFTLPVATGTPGGSIVTIVASRDRRYLALATSSELVVISAARLLPILVTPATNISGIAWSPDGKQLAVAQHAAIDIWTLPKTN